MNFKVRPWISWADFALIGVACLVLVCSDWLQYEDGFSGGCSFIIALPLLFSIPVFGLALLFLPSLQKKQKGWLHHIWIRPLLLGIGGLVLWLAHRFSPFYDHEVTPCLKGQLMSVQSIISDERLLALREFARLKNKELGAERGLMTVQAEAMPPFLSEHPWGRPRPLDLWAHRNGIEIYICWGWALPGYFGLLIDPETPPVEGVVESQDGAYQMHRKLKDNVWFYHTNG